MNARKERQNQILALIAKEPIATQDELILKLREHGFEVTQATVSRDIKELKLVKAIGPDGRSTYRAGANREAESFDSPSGGLLSGAVLSADYAMNTCVIKTRAGMAGAVCTSIDGMEWDGILGTIAGDDTIFVLCRNETKARNFRDTVYTLIGR